MLDQTAAELNRALAAAGYSAPISTGETINRQWISGINEYGAAALVLGSMPMTALSPGKEEAGNNRMEMFQAFFNAALKTIAEQRLSAGRSRGRLGAVKSGSATDSDGNTKLPLFKRGQDDYPGSRSLVES